MKESLWYYSVYLITRTTQLLTHAYLSYADLSKALVTGASTVDHQMYSWINTQIGSVSWLDFNKLLLELVCFVDLWLVQYYTVWVDFSFLSTSLVCSCVCWHSWFTFLLILVIIVQIVNQLSRIECTHHRALCYLREVELVCKDATEYHLCP